jgi:hypothetical protein
LHEMVILPDVECEREYRMGKRKEGKGFGGDG